ncbi:MAG TPA: TonB-dependent receptor [Caulobacteraceae bacterium]
MTADPPPPAEIVVSAARLPPSPADAAFSIIRLAPETLAENVRLDDALATVPGASLFRRTSSLGANPTTQGISLRGIAGSGASRALVTLDGVPRNDPFGGWVIWTSLPPEDLSGAVIVRGAGAGPYGAGALTGVITLEEAAPPPGAWSVDGQLGQLGQARAAATASLAAGPGTLFVAGAAEHSDGWIPVWAGRGAADTRLTLDDYSASARLLADLGPATAAARISAYQEDRGAGLAGAESRARGVGISFTAARPPEAASLGWRAQTWVSLSDLANSSVSVAPGRASTSPADDQYRTPAIGYGANLAVRKVTGADTFELGLDGRGAAGESDERFKPVMGVLTFDRSAGGQTASGGAYGEATQTAGPLLLTAGLRLDGWAQFDGHRLERKLATDAVTLALKPADRGGVLPSARLAARLETGQGGFLRAAAYSGFRPPTLNELYRPFRVGNDVTEANAALTPERLYGVEIGAGSDGPKVAWDVTGFYNRLTNAVTNVTIADGPFTDPVEGFIPAGGTLLQRRNIGAVNALGVEADASARLGTALTGSAAFDWTLARVDGGAAAPALTGLRPAETPRLAATAGLTWRAAPRIELIGEMRYESARFDDDQNLRRLDPAVSFNARAQLRLKDGAIAFVAADNLFDAAVATGKTADGVISYGPPRAVRIGFSISDRE